jgi:hypothetical protein
VGKYLEVGASHHIFGGNGHGDMYLFPMGQVGMFKDVEDM